MNRRAKRKVIFKKYLKEEVMKTDLRQRYLLAEINILSVLKHKNVIRLLNVFQDFQYLILVLEKSSGTSLEFALLI